MRAGDVVGGRYELERLAGSGGMGTIFRARDRLTGRIVALKLMIKQSAEGAARFEREAVALSRIFHPAMVGYVDHGVAPEGRCWLAMEWIEGESLAQRIRREELTVHEAVTVVRRVAEGLGAAHAAGVVHRDVKPSNVLLADGQVDRAKVLDLGIARLEGDAERLTLTGVMIGTPGYAAPEQARDSSRVDARADVFSLGCLLFRCLTGKLPFVGKSAAAVLIKTMLEDAP